MFNGSNVRYDTSMRMSLPRQMVIVFMCISIIGNMVLIGFIAFNPKNIQPTSLKEPTAVLPYLSPRIFTENPNDVIINFIDLRNQLKTYTAAIPDRLGVYFEYLPSGNSIGINEKEEYELASLLKVPIAMAAIDQIRSGKMSASTPLTLSKSDLDPYYGELWQEGPGYKLTLEKAIEIMLVKSDNTAARVISDALPNGATEKIFDLLDIPKVQKGVALVVTAKNYSSILRSLYLSSILQIKDSNELLNILTRTDFNDQIAGGIPKDIKVAHKIGVHTSVDETKSIFTDCGIVYVPKRPYIICVMVESKEQQAKQYMKELSRIIYTYVTSANTKK